MRGSRQRGIYLITVALWALPALPLAAEDGGDLIRLVRPAGEPVAGQLRLETVTSREPIDHVVFYLDGVEAGVAAHRPFAARLDLGTEPRPCEVLAAAFDAEGRRIGHDRLWLNQPPRAPGIEITRLAPTGIRGEFEIAAEARPPERRKIERLDIYWGDDLLASLDRPPWRARVIPERPAANDVVTALARFDDGSTLETARIAGATAERLDVRLVELLAVVTDRARHPRADLEAEDFTIFDGGRPLPVTQLVRGRELPLELGLVVDTSESMRLRHSDLRSLGTRVLEQTLAPGDRAFMVDFNSGPRLSGRATGDVASLVDSFGDLELDGHTALYDAILYALLQFDPGVRRRALVVLTDGDESASSLGPDRAIREARRRGVPIYMLTLGERPDPRRHPRRILAERLARDTGGRIEYLPTGTRLEQVTERLERELASQYLLAYVPPAEAAIGGDRSLRVEVRGRGLDVRAVRARP